MRRALATSLVAFSLVSAPSLAEGGVHHVSFDRPESESYSPKNEPLEPVRLAGENRYDTAARVARAWPSNQEVVFVVSGEGYADALTASTRAGALDAPVLLTRHASLPSATVEALQHLRPKKAVVVGGAEAVSAAALEQLRSLTSSGQVVRLAGANRYETAAAVSSTYDSGPSQVYLASGEGFPDALAGAALAGHEGVPLLLASGSGLRSSIVAEMKRLKADKVIVLGGELAVPESVAKQAAQYTVRGDYERIAGKNRYETATAAAAQFGEAQTSLYVASGVDFPDALATAALGAREATALILSPPDHVASSTAQFLQTHPVNDMVIVGGREAIHDGTVQDLVDVARPGYLPGWGMPDYSDEFTYVDPTTGEPTLDRSKWNTRPRSDLGLTFDAAETRDEQLVVDEAGVLHIYGEWMDEPKRSGRENGIQWLTHWTGYLDHRPLREGDFTYAQQYGRWEIRAKVPSGPKTLGSLAAFWLRNEQSGEIDIMEAWGYNDSAAPGGQRIDTATTTVHTHTSDPQKNEKYIWHHEDYGAATPVWDDFHVYAFELTPTYAAIYFDGEQIHRVTPDTHPNLWDPKYFGTPLHVRLNLHVGPSATYWGLPDPNNRQWTKDPLDYAIDYVRIYAYEE